MTKHRVAQIVAVLVLVAAVGAGVARRAKGRITQPLAPVEPQDAVYSMLNAARAGDVKGYLASFAGEIEARVRRAATEQGEPQFSRYLADSQLAVQGVTVTEPVDVGSGEMKVSVEYVYQDRNEKQTVFLKKAGGAWKVSQLGNEARAPTLIPYGTPVNRR